MTFSRYIDTMSIKAGFLAILALGGCIATTFPYMRAETAQRLASPAWMIKRDIPAGDIELRAFERIHERGGIANLYIEGDGTYFEMPTVWQNDPTPQNPIALHMATKDKAENLIYLARPCQYSGGTDCPKAYWNEGRFSQDVIDSYNLALDEIAKRYQIRGFHLIGYSGGAAVASLLATQRSDILSLRTVAGLLDHETFTAITGRNEFSSSLNPARSSSQLKDLPQYHFIGGQDTDIPPAVLHSYLEKVPATNCIQTMVVQEATHMEGWVDKWPEMLDLPVTCYHGKAAPTTYSYEIPLTISPEEPKVKMSPERPVKP